MKSYLLDSSFKVIGVCPCFQSDGAGVCDRVVALTTY